MKETTKINDYKLMEWFGFMIVLIMLFTEEITRNWLGEIWNLSLFAFIGILVGSCITFLYTWKRRKLINK
ncbi:hypothetical protein [Gracilibacillus massiliensis]|uniref:hypothetical protein n=1 Tax=Gracilibacillus massiliensis TaxID=1564956 RepID=UPI00071D8090|nr:hypothetical protein [Gracilibacillus massiliensis]